MDDIYNSRILEFAGNIQRSGKLDDADASAEKHSKLCGSRVKVYLKMKDGRVSDFAHEVKACALGQASSSIMARHVVGATPAEIREALEAAGHPGADVVSVQGRANAYMLRVNETSTITEEVQAAIGNALAWPLQPQSPKLLDALTEELALIVSGKKKPKAALASAQAAWEQILKA